MKKTQTIVPATHGQPALSIKTNVKAGRIGLNHNAKAIKAARMKTDIKAGMISPNHSAMLIKA